MVVDKQDRLARPTPEEWKMSNWYHGHGGSGPAREIWLIGDRVRHQRVPGNGTVDSARREPNAAETHFVWVNWDDGESGFVDPNILDVASKRPNR